MQGFKFNKSTDFKLRPSSFQPSSAGVDLLVIVLLTHLLFHYQYLGGNLIFSKFEICFSLQRTFSRKTGFSTFNLLFVKSEESLPNQFDKAQQTLAYAVSCIIWN